VRSRVVASAARTFPLRPEEDGARSRIRRAADASRTAGFYRGRVSGRLTDRQIDLLVVGAALALSLPALVHAATNGRLAIGLGLLPFATVPLLWRRRRPGTVLVVLAGSLAVAAAAGRAAPTGAGVIFAVYAAARYGGERVRAATSVAAIAVTLTAFGLLLATGRGKLLPRLSAPVALGVGGAWALGEVTRTRQAYLAEVERRAERLEHERDEHARLAAEQERIRIARELHDVVTHHVSAIAVQAAAAHSTSRHRPERALQTLGLIERTARTTLGELRTLLGVLRAGEDPAPLAPLQPHPSIGRLDELVAQAEAAGVAVDTEVRGGPAALDAVVELGAYRVLQEALTNVMKHAPGSRATVVVDYGASELTVAVTDDGPGRGRPGASGHGLVGMRERVELAGGELRAGPMPRGGFRVEARLPLAGATQEPARA
jgi:signal transduction histidine kinase